VSEPTKPHSEEALTKAIHLFNSESRKTKELCLQHNCIIRIPKPIERILLRPDINIGDPVVGPDLEIVCTQDMAIEAIERLEYTRERLQWEQMHNRRLEHLLSVEREARAKQIAQQTGKVVNNDTEAV